MKLSVLTVPFSHQGLDQVLPYLRGLGVEQVELGTGGYTNKAHCDPAYYLARPGRTQELKRLLADNGMSISALSCHGNPVHPDGARAAADHQTYLDTLRLANLLEVDTVVTFSGCPGGGPGDATPNWVTCPWPEDFARTLDYQWNEVLFPYWEGAARLAREAGVRVAIEMHPGFCVYNPDTLLRLRSGVGETVGANFDPSHLFWQGVDPAAAIRALGEAIYHVHAKDTRIDPQNTGRAGVLDTKGYHLLRERSWVFCTVGWGHGEPVWRDILSALRLAGYDGAVSIEHEDGLMSIREGLEKAVDVLKPMLIRDTEDGMWWL